MIKVRRKIHFATKERGRRVLAEAPGVAAVQQDRIPRISRLMALAIHFDRLIREGTVKDMSELACLVHVTQPRITQIMNLNHLAPEIQEQLLFFSPVEAGRERIHERRLRPLAAEVDWHRQQKLWQELNGRLAEVT